MWAVPNTRPGIPLSVKPNAVGSPIRSAARSFTSNCQLSPAFISRAIAGLPSIVAETQQSPFVSMASFNGPVGGVSTVPVVGVGTGAGAAASTASVRRGSRDNGRRRGATPRPRVPEVGRADEEDDGQSHEATAVLSPIGRERIDRDSMRHFFRRRQFHDWLFEFRPVLFDDFFGIEMHFAREGSQVAAREQAARDAIEPVFLDRAQDGLIDLRTGGNVAQRELASGSCRRSSPPTSIRMDGDASGEPGQASGLGILLAEGSLPASPSS